jgi:cell shape-determining protein MreD
MSSQVAATVSAHGGHATAHRRAWVGLCGLAALLAALVLVESALAGQWPVWGPELVPASAVAVGLCRRSLVGACYGFAAGLAIDLLASPAHLVGLWALGLAVVGYLSGRVGASAAPGVAGQAVLGVIGTAGGLALVTLLGGLFGVPQPSAATLGITALSVASWAAPVTPLAARLVGGLRGGRG